MSKDDLFKACLDHCDILRFEFILNKPCQNIDTLLNETLERLRDRDLVHLPQVYYYTVFTDKMRKLLPCANRWCTQKNRNGHEGLH